MRPPSLRPWRETPHMSPHFAEPPPRRTSGSRVPALPPGSRARARRRVLRLTALEDRTVPAYLGLVAEPTYTTSGYAATVVPQVSTGRSHPDGPEVVGYQVEGQAWGPGIEGGSNI